MLGLSFKPETDDIRDAPALDIARALLARGAIVRAYDPEAMPAVGQRIPEIERLLDDLGRFGGGKPGGSGQVRDQLLALGRLLHGRNHGRERVDIPVSCPYSGSDLPI